MYYHYNKVYQSDGISYEPEAEALFSAFTTPPTDARKSVINNTILIWKGNGFWDEADVIAVFDAETSQAGLVNWKNPAHTFTLVNSPTFTVDQGFTGNGTSSYIDLNWNPSVDAVKMTLNSTGMHCSSRSAGSANGVLVGGGDNNIHMLSVSPKWGDGKLYTRINQPNATFLNAINGDFAGDYTSKRTASNAIEVFKDGSSLGTHTYASDALTGRNLYALCLNNNGTPQLFVAKQISFLAFSSGVPTAIQARAGYQYYKGAI